jgi:hypothetical protein
MLCRLALSAGNRPTLVAALPESRGFVATSIRPRTQRGAGVGDAARCEPSLTVGLRLRDAHDCSPLGHRQTVAQASARACCRPVGPRALRGLMLVARFVKGKLAALVACGDP